MAVQTITIDGLEEFDEALAKLPSIMASRVVRDALTAAAQPVIVKAKELAPVDTGQLRDSIKLQKVYVQKGGFESYADIGCTERDYVGDQFYAAFIEYGYHRGKRNAAQRRDPNVGDRPEVEARPFLRPAIDAKQGEAEAILAEKLGAGVEEALRE